MNYPIDIQHASKESSPVTDEQLRDWVILALQLELEAAELTLRLVNPEEMTALNHLYRKKNKPTNVLAFPASHPAHIELECPLLGDVIICPQVLEEESQSLNTPLIAHWAHIVIHGVLHLLGYDHMNEDDTNKMQSIEIQLLAVLGFDNPYESEVN